MADEIPQEAIQKLESAGSDEEKRQIEAELLEPTDNGWQEGDPEVQPDQEPLDGNS